MRLVDIKGKFTQKFKFLNDKSRGLNIEYMIINPFGHISKEYITFVDLTNGGLCSFGPDQFIWEHDIELT